jgi:predicted ester cyclase
MLLPTSRRRTWVGKEEAAVSDEEKNKALVRCFFEAQTKEDLDVISELLAPDFIDHNLHPFGHQGPGREGYIEAVAEDHAIFSDFRYLIEDQVATEDKVVSRITARGIHDRGKYLGIAPTGREAVFTGIVIHRIVGGKIVEEWSEGSTLGEAMGQRLEQEVRERERERVEQELQVARRIQQASLPKDLPTLEGWEISPLYDQPGR